MVENLMTVAEVAARWRLGHLAVRRRILDGELRAVRIGRNVRIEEAEVERYERTWLDTSNPEFFKGKPKTD